MSGFGTGVRYLFSLQLFARVATFAVNAAIARRLGPQWYGVVQVQLQLLLSTVLFLSREGPRRAAQRCHASDDKSADGAADAAQHRTNCAALSLPLAVLIAGALLAKDAFFVGGGDGAPAAPADGGAALPGDYRRGAAVLCLAGIVEILGEPMWVHAQTHVGSMLGARVLAEGVGVATRSLLTLGMLTLHGGEGQRVTQLALAQLGFAVAYLLVLSFRLVRTHGVPLRTFLPRRASDGSWLSARHAAASSAMALHTAEKFVLNEGERLVLVGTCGEAEQGVFALVSNLGSLLARLALQPVEEMAFAFFAGAPAADGRRALAALTRAAAIFGGVIAAFGPAHAPLLLQLLYGGRWSGSGAARALGAYSGYVLFMAVNGVTEAFVHATADREQLRELNVAMVLMSAAYIAFAVQAVGAFGVEGLIAANAFSMAMRIAYSARCIRRGAVGDRGGGGRLKFLPGAATVAALVASFATTMALQRELDGGLGILPLVLSQAGQLAAGMAMLGGVAAVVYMTERDLLRELRSVLRRKRD